MLSKCLVSSIIIVLLICLSVVSVNAEEITELQNSVDSLMDSLSDEVKEDMQSLGVNSVSIEAVQNVSFDSVINLIADKLSENSTAPLSASAVVIAILILNALFDSYTDALKQSSTKEVLSVVSTLCITTTLVLPVIDLIEHCIATVTDASNFMLLYIPVMVAVLIFSGQAITGASYYSFMVLACQGVTQFSTRIISPFLHVSLGFCVSSSISDRVNLKGICNMFSKVIKWLIAFTMTVFSALMTIRGLITTAYDSVTARAVRFTMSSFIPIVGAALSESYKTIQGSINLLRTGAGVFVILAILVVFLPSVIKCIVWMLSLSMCKTIGEMMGVSSPMSMLTSVSSVVSTVFAITACVMSIFVISTALLITLGGGAQ